MPGPAATAPQLQLMRAGRLLRMLRQPSLQRRQRWDCLMMQRMGLNAQAVLRPARAQVTMRVHQLWPPRILSQPRYPKQHQQQCRPSQCPMQSQPQHLQKHLHPSPSLVQQLMLWHSLQQPLPLSLLRQDRRSAVKALWLHLDRLRPAPQARLQQRGTSKKLLLVCPPSQQLLRMCRQRRQQQVLQGLLVILPQAAGVMSR